MILIEWTAYEDECILKCSSCNSKKTVIKTFKWIMFKGPSKVKKTIKCTPLANDNTINCWRKLFTFYSTLFIPLELGRGCMLRRMTRILILKTRGQGFPSKNVFNKTSKDNNFTRSG